MAPMSTVSMDASMLEQGRKVFEIEKPVEKPFTRWLRKLVRRLYFRDTVMIHTETTVSQQQSRKGLCLAAALYMLFLVVSQNSQLPASLRHEGIARPAPDHKYLEKIQLEPISSCKFIWTRLCSLVTNPSLTRRSTSFRCCFPCRRDFTRRSA